MNQLLHSLRSFSFRIYLRVYKEDLKKKISKNSEKMYLSFKYHCRKSINEKKDNEEEKQRVHSKSKSPESKLP